MSTIGDVKAALVALIAATLTDNQVIYGPATNVTELADEVVTVGNVTGVSELDALGGNTTTEDYLVEVVLSVSLPGADTQQSATAAVLANWLAVKAAVLASSGRTLGVAGVMDAKPVGDFELTEASDASGRTAAIKTAVRIQAQGL